MHPGHKTIITGLAVLAGGTALWLFGADVEIVVFTPSKIGVVLMALGAVEALYGVYRVVTDDGARSRKARRE
ncbi:DUF5708 family protein [Nonomuraea sp. MCN248]|uniref:DUF5708 family protein n=1 Tax=Nonomuraea corallina TaxID=2989783 RepID=A0ABT4SFR4_9ACTN|nr:DUF5708 family protein [Nonomuraea corallina]MDA0635868.1 DUF5708 family protein [Nonomuraea corallina]